MQHSKRLSTLSTLTRCVPSGHRTAKRLARQSRSYHPPADGPDPAAGQLSFRTVHYFYCYFRFASTILSTLFLSLTFANICLSTFTTLFLHLLHRMPHHCFIIPPDAPCSRLCTIFMRLSASSRPVASTMLRNAPSSLASSSAGRPNSTAVPSLITSTRS